MFAVAILFRCTIFRMFGHAKKRLYFAAHLMGSNHRLSGYEPDALTSELRCVRGTFVHIVGSYCFTGMNAIYRALTAAAPLSALADRGLKAVMLVLTSPHSCR